MSLMSPSPAPKADVFYPSSDGEPMAETPIHVRAIMLLDQALEDFLAALTDVYLAADMFWYWEEGNAAARRAPDIMVIKGVGRAERRSFFSWREHGAVPCFIVEFASENSWREDLFEKKRLYEKLGVREYFIFDPEGLYLRPVLQGFRLDDQSRYVSLEPDTADRLKSEQLGVYLRGEGTMLRLIDVTTGQPVLTRAERTEQAQRQANEERRRAAQAEAEVARLRALLEQAQKAQKEE